MAQPDARAGSMKREVEQTARQAVDHPWFAYLARFGYGAKGVVYLIAAALSAMAVLGLRGDAGVDKVEALQTVFTGPLGRIALVVIAVGLVGYALLRFVQALLDPEHKGSDAKGVLLRAGYILRGAVYAAIAITVLRLALAGGGDAGGAQGLVARLFGLPFGRWLAGLAGVLIIGAGLWEIYRGWTADFSEHLRWNEMSAAERTWVGRLGRAGLVARGLVWAVAGGFLVQAALLLDAGRVRDSGGAVQALAELVGWWLVGVVALGLMAYGVYMLAVARYGRIVTR